MNIIINDESITNDRGWRLRNEGCDLSRYLANPIVLYQHDTGKIIGRTKDIRIEGSKLIASIEFDEEDAEAREVKRKVDKNFLRGVSPGLYIGRLEYGEDYDIVNEWELIEISIVTIPSNRGALRLYAQDGGALTQEEEKQYIQQLKANYINPMSKTTTTNQASDTLFLSTEAYHALNAEHSESSETLSAKIVALAEEYNKVKGELAEKLTAERDALITAAVKDGRIKEADRERFNNLFAHDAEMCKGILSSISKPQSLGSILNVPTVEDQFSGTWDELDAKGQLAALRNHDPELFKKKYAERFSSKTK